MFCGCTYTDGFGKASSETKETDISRYRSKSKLLIHKMFTLILSLVIGILCNADLLKQYVSTEQVLL